MADTPPGSSDRDTPPAEPRKNRPAATSAFGTSMREAGPYFGLGIELAVSMTFFVLAGYFADQWLGTAPWLLIAGVALSALATGVTLWRLVREVDQQGDRPPPPKGGSGGEVEA